jgi:arylamine N-acetyltransferase
MLIIATIGGKKYNIDVGFTTFGITKPLPLDENVIMPCIPGLEARHVKQTMAQSVTDQWVWVFETRNVHSNEWSPGYCFTEVEWLPQDFDAMNLQLSADPMSWTTYTLLVTKLLLKENQVEGMLTMFNTFVQKRVGGGEAELLEVLGSEAERVKALEKYFGIVISEEQINGITGRVTEIKADPKSE